MESATTIRLMDFASYSLVKRVPNNIV